MARRRHDWLWGRVFAVASVATPLFLGVIVGAITEGKLPATPQGSFTAVFIAPWLTPFSVAVGVFALALFANLAAVYLTLEARDADERAAFRRRALGSSIAVAVLAAIVLALAQPDVRTRLITSTWAVPVQIAACGRRDRGVRIAVVQGLSTGAGRGRGAGQLDSLGLGAGAVSLRRPALSQAVRTAAAPPNVQDCPAPGA